MTMRPFLFLGTRAEDEVAQQEYDAVLAGTGLRPDELVRVRLEAGTLGWVELDDWSGIILGGGPFNMSDRAEDKSSVQHRVEAELHDLAERVVATDHPFLGACYGIGVLGTRAGGVVDRTYGEPVGALPVRLTPAGLEDPLFGRLPEVFSAFLGHKEAVSRLPEGGVLLASTDTCPVHAFRIGRNVYATQFHPELDAAASLRPARCVQRPRLLRAARAEVVEDRCPRGHGRRTRPPAGALRRAVRPDVGRPLLAVHPPAAASPWDVGEWALPSVN